MRMYLDAAIVIYFVQRVLPYAGQIRTRLAASDTMQVVSELTRLECRVQPLRDGNAEVLHAFDTYFTAIPVEIVPLSREVIDQATDIRASYGFKTPDSLHLAAAVVSGCDVFFTHDRQLTRYRGLSVETLP